jgi:hypothetical protein
MASGVTLSDLAIFRKTPSHICMHDTSMRGERRACVHNHKAHIIIGRSDQDALDETEERKHVAQVVKLDIKRAARETNDPLPTQEIVQEMLQNQKQSTRALGQHMRDLVEQSDACSAQGGAGRASAGRRVELDLGRLRGEGGRNLRFSTNRAPTNAQKPEDQLRSAQTRGPIVDQSYRAPRRSTCEKTKATRKAFLLLSL